MSEPTQPLEAGPPGPPRALFPPIPAPGVPSDPYAGWSGPALAPPGPADPAPPPGSWAPAAAEPTSTPPVAASALPPAPAAPAYAPGADAGPPQRARRGPLVALVAAVGLVTGLLGGLAGAALVERNRSAATMGGPVAGPALTTRPEGSIARIAAAALPSVVTIRISSGSTSGNGSGFVIDRAGHVVTNNHVVAPVAGSGKILVELSDGTSLPATIVGREASYDLAVLKVERTDLTPLEWGRSADVVVGDPVLAVGAPLGLESTVTSGIVSALHRPVVAGGGSSDRSFIDAIQTDAAINPGNSGGPLLDFAGRVIGVNSAIARDPGSSSDVSGNIGVGFAIPSDQAAKTAASIISTGKADYPVVGVRLDTRFEGDGARILSPGGVTPGSPAATAGLRDGDVVVEFEGRRIATPNQLIVAIRARSIGDTVKLVVERDGTRETVTLTLQGSG